MFYGNLENADEMHPFAQCHICGQQVPFTYGNPKELIQHMLKCQSKGPHQWNPLCCPPHPHVTIIDCPKRKLVGRSTPTCSCMNDSTAKKSALKNPLKVRIHLCDKTKEAQDHKFNINIKENRVNLDKRVCGGGPPKKKANNLCSECPMKARNKSNQNEEYPGSWVASKPEKLDKSSSATSQIEKKWSSSDEEPQIDQRLSVDEPNTVLCRKSVCFAKNLCGNEKTDDNNNEKPYSACNLNKRKGAKQMHKTTLDSWQTGCGTMICQKCNQTVIPLIRKQKSKLTSTSIGASLLLTCWPFCFCLPGLHTCKLDLYCPNCKHKIGVYNSSTGKTSNSITKATKSQKC